MDNVRKNFDKLSKLIFLNSCASFYLHASFIGTYRRKRQIVLLIFQRKKYFKWN